jgi:hypothetical protein
MNRASAARLMLPFALATSSAHAGFDHELSFDQNGTDVIAGWALGTGVGYWSTTRPVPVSVQLLPDGLSVGFSKRF